MRVLCESTVVFHFRAMERSNLQCTTECDARSHRMNPSGEKRREEMRERSNLLLTDDCGWKKEFEPV